MTEIQMPETVPPMPAPVSIKLGVYDLGEDVLTAVRYTVLEFHSLNGASVYFLDKEMTQKLMNSLREVQKTTNKPKLHIARSMPDG